MGGNPGGFWPEIKDDKIMICYLSRNYRDVNSAGNKAKTDVEQIMENLHCKNTGLNQTVCKNSIVSFVLTLASVLKCGFCLHKGDMLVLQYPLKKYYSFVCNIAHFRGCKVITLIHDLGCFRRKKQTEAQEILRLNHADYIIAHNDVMKKWLEDRNCQAQVGSLEIFDFLSPSQPEGTDKIRKPYRVTYAGGLSLRKNAFLYEVGEFVHSYRFVLYGSGFEKTLLKGENYFDYKGFIAADQLIASAAGDFGLVWDGSSIASCSGNWGEYLQYNNPHKTSLYIRCGFPVIIWEKAALSGFVRKNNIGICIASLEDLDTVLSVLSEDQYVEMAKNVTEISKRLSEGYYFSTALQRAVSELKRKTQSTPGKRCVF